MRLPPAQSAGRSVRTWVGIRVKPAWIVEEEHRTDAGEPSQQTPGDRFLSTASLPNDGMARARATALNP